MNIHQLVGSEDLGTAVSTTNPIISFEHLPRDNTRDPLSSRQIEVGPQKWQKPADLVTYEQFLTVTAERIERNPEHVSKELIASISLGPTIAPFIVNISEMTEAPARMLTLREAETLRTSSNAQQHPESHYYPPTLRSNKQLVNLPSIHQLTTSQTNFCRPSDPYSSATRLTDPHLGYNDALSNASVNATLSKQTDFSKNWVCCLVS
jgi:hypothetical protein